jgi:hypothetical protein
MVEVAVAWKSENVFLGQSEKNNPPTRVKRSSTHDIEGQDDKVRDVAEGKEDDDDGERDVDHFRQISRFAFASDIIRLVETVVCLPKD